MRSKRVQRAFAGTTRLQMAAFAVFLSGALGWASCKDPGKSAPAPSSSAPPAKRPAEAPKKIEHRATAMGTTITLIAYTSPEVDEAKTRSVMEHAVAELVKIEDLMTSWRDDSEIGQINQRSGSFVKVSPDTRRVIEKSLWAGEVSEGTFDITFKTMSSVWKFGSVSDPNPTPPEPSEVKRLQKLVDYRNVEIDQKAGAVRIAKGTKIGLGGIAKGFAVDRVADVLRAGGVSSFLAQAGGDLYGAGRKPDGSNWTSGIRDPRGKEGSYFATLPLENRAFSTAGDYARSYVHEGKRYHHIIDPRTGYPATASRSVTVWAKTAFLADAVDDAVFILGPKKGLALVESLEDVGAVIVDDKNQVHVSQRLKGKVTVRRPPTDGI